MRGLALSNLSSFSNIPNILCPEIMSYFWSNQITHGTLHGDRVVDCKVTSHSRMEMIDQLKWVAHGLKSRWSYCSRCCQTDLPVLDMNEQWGSDPNLAARIGQEIWHRAFCDLSNGKHLDIMLYREEFPKVQP